MKVFVFCFFALLLFFSGCSPRVSSPRTFQGTQVLYGSGGGISGSVQSHILLGNGQLFSRNSLNGEIQYLKKVEAKTFHEVFEQVNTLFQQEPNINHPGNIYYFIELKTTQNTRRISWGAADYQVPATVQHIYNRLVHL